MAKIQWSLILATLIVSSLAFVFYVVSIATDSWLEATAVLTDRLENSINYGLFSGKLDRQQLAATIPFDLSVVCDFSEGACIYSCQRNASARSDELRRILRGEELESCDAATSARLGAGIYSQPWTEIESKAENPVAQYIPAGIWLCTVIFLILAILLTAAAAAFALLNLSYNPVEPMFNVFGLYIWNGAAATFSLISLSLWGGLFDNYLQYNVAVTDTLREQLTFSSRGMANIGFSFYMLLLAFMLNLTNLAILFIRSYILSRTDAPPTITIAQNDAPLEFY